jgi:manganese/iron transport system permease protein
MQLLSAVLGVAAGVIGLYISFWWNVASGGAVVLTTTAIFFVVFVAVELGPRMSRSKKLRPARSGGAG